MDCWSKSHLKKVYKNPEPQTQSHSKLTCQHSKSGMSHDMSNGNKYKIGEILVTQDNTPFLIRKISWQISCHCTLKLHTTIFPLKLAIDHFSCLVNSVTLVMMFWATCSVIFCNYLLLSEALCLHSGSFMVIASEHCAGLTYIVYISSWHRKVDIMTRKYINQL